MIKLNMRSEDGDLYYAEIWVSPDDETGTINVGKVGKRGKVTHFDMLDDPKSASKFMAYYKKFYEDAGYYKFNNDALSWLVVQFPMKSVLGNKRDHWLREKVTEQLNDELGWCGLGKVDGFDMGALSVNNSKYALNIFCIVNDEQKGVLAVKRRLRENRLDYTQVKIATCPYDSEDEYKLVYSAKRDDQSFSI